MLVQFVTSCTFHCLCDTLNGAIEYAYIRMYICI